MEIPARPSAPVTAILVAAGSSRRMGFDKLAADLRGLPVLRRSLEALFATPEIAEVVVVCPAERLPLLAGPRPKPLRRVDGGAERQDSVLRGLAAADPASGWVAVHDGARPLVDPRDISRCIAAVRAHRAAALARRATETMKRADEDDFSLEAVPRERLWCMETPQVAELALLREACGQAAARGLRVTDEVSALEAAGQRVKLIESRHPNPKITTPADLALAAALWDLRP